MSSCGIFLLVVLLLRVLPVACVARFHRVKKTHSANFLFPFAPGRESTAGVEQRALPVETTTRAYIAYCEVYG